MAGTSDGILEEDWNVVKSICIEIVNLLDEDDDFLELQKHNELFDYLNILEMKYGERASIFATRADYVENPKTKVLLLHKAFEIAKANGDFQNLTYISSSLAQTYIEELENLIEGKKWLDELKSCLANFWDQGEEEEMNRLKKVFPNEA